MLTAFYKGLLYFSAEPISVLGILLLLGSLYAPLLWLMVKKIPRVFLRAILPLMVFTLLTLFLRLAFISKPALPLYFDSAEHWRIIAAILKNNSLLNLTPTYYHIGYHVLAAFLSALTKTNITHTMFISGQVILALIPFPIYIFIWHETKSISAALFSALLSSFAWSMPSFALNWGKYPMLSGFLLGTTVLLYLHIFPARQRQKKILASIAILATIFLHSRMLVFFLIAFASRIFAEKISARGKKEQRIALGFGLGISLLTGLLIEKNILLKPALDPYLDAPNSYITFSLIPLSLLAYKKSSRDFFFSLYMIVGLLVSLYLPFNGNFLGVGKLTLLDRPFVETLLYLPLAIIGGLGIAQLSQILPNSYAKKWFFIVLFVSFSLYSLQNYDFTPSTCCNFVNADDIAAMTWIRENTPTNAKFLVAADPLKVTPGTSPQNLSGTDAGIWLTNLTGRAILKFPYYSDFDKKSTQTELCQKRINYIYASDQPFSFNRSLHLSEQGWYQEVVSLPKVRIFALRGCLQ